MAFLTDCLDTVLRRALFVTELYFEPMSDTHDATRSVCIVELIINLVE